MNGNNQNRTAGQKLNVQAGGNSTGKRSGQPLPGNMPCGTVVAPLANVPPPMELLTRRELAARCQVDVRTIERWQAEGVVPFIKVREVVRFHWPTTIAHLLTHFTVLHDGEDTQGKN